MKRTALLLALTMAALVPQAASAQDDQSGGIDEAKAAAFDKRVFGRPVGKKAAACFVRRYDPNHLAKHPKQKVAAMKLLLTAENHPDEPTSHAYKISVQFRNKRGDFDGGSSCGHMEDDNGKNEISFSCDVACGGGGIEIAMAKDAKSAIVRLEVIEVTDRKHPSSDAVTLEGGKDDKVFRLDRVDSSECADLTDRKAVASLQRK